jgi:zona occludens toxin
MAITIVHGSNGSYKTASAVSDFFVPAVYDGRVVITNIRGLRLRDEVIERLARHNPKHKPVSDNFDVIYLNHDDEQDLFRLRTFWHWAPAGALILIDEGQIIWPRSWRQSDIDKLTADDAFRRENCIEGEPRPDTFLRAFTMHRHYGWDIVITTPDIGLIRPEIRDTTEAARLQQSLAFVGLSGFFRRRYHHGRHTGVSNSHIIKSEVCRVPRWIFNVYQSAVVSSDGVVHANVLPRIGLMLAAVILLFVFAATRGVKTFEGIHDEKAKKDVKQSAQSARQDVSGGSESGSQGAGMGRGKVIRGGGGDARNTVGHGRLIDRVRDGLISPSIYITGSVRLDDGTYTYFFEVPSGDEYFTVSSDDVRRTGVTVVWRDQCHAVLASGGVTSHVYCRGWRATTLDAELPQNMFMPFGGESGQSLSSQQVSSDSVQSG